MILLERIVMWTSSLTFLARVAELMNMEPVNRIWNEIVEVHRDVYSFRGTVLHELYHTLGLFLVFESTARLLKDTYCPDGFELLRWGHSDTTNVRPGRRTQPSMLSLSAHTDHLWHFPFILNAQIHINPLHLFVIVDLIVPSHLACSTLDSNGGLR